MQTMLTWVLAFNAVVLLALGANFAGTVAAAVHCANRKNFDGKTSWVMIIILLPVAGWIAYWCTTRKAQPPFSPQDLRNPPPPPPQAQTEHDVARAVSAALSEEIRLRRSRR